MHSAYFETRFIVSAEPTDWPDEFVIVSAHATTGERWTTEENEGAHLELLQEVERLGARVGTVVGFSPTTGHAEPSVVAKLPLSTGCDLGMRFRQDAIYHVLGDQLSVTYCDDRRGLVPVGACFQVVLDVALAQEEQNVSHQA
ncbi:MAG: DUF3293 domain-containing protein, partial [Gemmatimonadetes bacterium]|nr:DUF3293 domain-containing protein [Gemmatimonadota bacterium]